MMDPPLINEGSFSTANPSMAEIWPLNGGDSGLLGLRMGSGSFGSSLIDNLLNNNGGHFGHINRDVSLEESTVTDQSGSLGCGGSGLNTRKRRQLVSQDESSKKDLNGKRMKTSGSGEENGCSKAGGEAGSANPGEKAVEPLKDYIHVRARRGQATDSHSLAERVIGKAIVLDEIINYIQSLQRQVEFLSMKLEAVNSGMIPSISGFQSKDVNQLEAPSFDPSGMMFSAHAARELAAAAAAGGPQSEWLHMQLGASFERPN
ncbi:hypothetical protein KSS87_019139 [Heliosperma pusillum]|nr:hypothetical protein KSS87_019139 [Heliosperma pusillum]